MTDKMLLHDRLMHAERLAWNLAGCECLVLGSCKPDKFNKELATGAMLAVNDFVKHHIKKTRFLRKKREYAENKLASANNRINALVSNFDIMLDQRSADVDEINRLERLLESANRRIAELNIRLLDARGEK